MPRDVKSFLMSSNCRDAIRALDDPATVNWLDRVIKSNTFAFGDIVDEGPEFDDSTSSTIKIGQLREMKIGRSNAMLRVVTQSSYPRQLNVIPGGDGAAIPPAFTYTLVPTVARVPLDLPVANVAYNPRPSLAGTCPSRVESEDQSAARQIEEKRQQESDGPAQRGRQQPPNNLKNKRKGKDKLKGKSKSKHKKKKSITKHKNKKKKQKKYDEASSDESTPSESSSEADTDSSSSDQNQSSQPDDPGKGICFRYSIYELYFDIMLYYDQ